MFSTISIKHRAAMAVAAVTIGGASVGLVTGFGDAETRVRETKKGQAGAGHSDVAATSDGRGAGAALGARVALRHGTGTGFAAIAVRAVETLEALAPTAALVVSPGSSGGGTSKAPESTLPRRVSVDLPSYQPGRPPSVSRPSVQPGEPPSVDPGWTTTVDLGTAPQVTPPTVDRGAPGTFRPPAVRVS